METQFIPYRQSSVHCCRFGRGAEWLVCLHGYGEDGSSFEILEDLLGHKYTLIAIDFPFHGKTDWQEGLLFTVADLLAVLDQLKPVNAPFSILGYSMGGRVGLQLVQTIPRLIKKIVLAAPDGLHKNKWQWLATRTQIGKRLFALTTAHPHWILWLMDLGGKMGLYNKRLLKFGHYYLDDPEQRTILYRRWITMRKFRPHRGMLKEIIIRNQIPVTLLFGRYDSVILSKHCFHFSKGSGSLIQVTEIEAGHQLLREKHAALIAGML